MAGSPELSFDPASMSNAVRNAETAEKPCKEGSGEADERPVADQGSDSEESEEEEDFSDWEEWPEGVLVLVPLRLFSNLACPRN
jgi:hypothetical protein